MATRSSKLLSLYALLFLQFLFMFGSAKPSGLSIKLIHRDSPESPFYPRVTTRMEHLVSATTSLNFRRNGSKDSMDTSLFRPRMDRQGLMYLVEVGIGMFAPPESPYYKYFLHLDAGSDLSWIQCEECRGTRWGSCFLQKPPLCPAKRSQTYHPLLCNRHRLCYPGLCINKTCCYDISYADGAQTLGYLAEESFTFHSVGSKTRAVIDRVFGCRIKNRGFEESSKTNLVVGNFGIGEGERSFLRQTRSQTQGQFLFCFSPWDPAHNSTIFLQFGDEIPKRGGLKVTSLLSYPGSMFYHVTMIGISMGKKRVNIPPRMFARKTNNHYGGCIVDTGSEYTTMPPQIYGNLKAMLIKNHFSRHKTVKTRGFLSLCYLFPGNIGLKDLPSITFHLQDADLVFSPQVLYEVGRITLVKDTSVWGWFPQISKA